MSKLGPCAAILAVAVASPVAADSVHATVVDGSTMAPIPGAVVTIVRQNGTRTLAANERGELDLDVDRAIDVTATAPGYEPATQTLDPAEPLILLFAPGALEVIELKGRPPASVTGSIALTRDEIRNLPGGSTDALAAVRSMPGVTQAPATSGGRLVIRGGAPQDSLLTVDGVPVPFLYHSFDNTTILPIGMIGAIGYSPGGFGVEEGRATSGAVAISTSDEPPARPTAMAQLSMLDVAAAGSTPVSAKHGVYLSGGVRRSTVDLLIPLTVPADLMLGFPVPPKFSDAQLRVDWRATARDRISVLALASYDRAGIVNHMPDGDLPADLDLTAQFNRVIGSWKHESANTRNRLVAAAGTGALDSTFDTIQHLDDHERMAMIRDDAAVRLDDMVTLRGGAFAQSSHHDLDAQAIVIPTDGLPPGHFDDIPIHSIVTSFDTSYAAAYTALDLEGRHTKLTAGARVEHFARIGRTVAEPRIELAHELGELTLHASAGRYARDFTDTQALATNLKPEVATQIAGGTDVRLADGLVASATVYHTERSQLAADDPMTTTVDHLGYASTGSGSSTGVDLLLRLQRDHLFGWIGYSFGNTARRETPGGALHATSFDQTHALTLVGSYQRAAWRFGARLAFASGLPYTDIVGATYNDQLGHYLPVLGATNGARYPNAAQLDLRVERGWKTKHVDLAAFIDISNVFRQTQVHRYQYNEDFSEKQPLTEYVPLPSIGVRGEF